MMRCGWCVKWVLRGTGTGQHSWDKQVRDWSQKPWLRFEFLYIGSRAQAGWVSGSSPRVGGVSIGVFKAHISAFFHKRMKVSLSLRGDAFLRNFCVVFFCARDVRIRLESFRCFSCLRLWYLSRRPELSFRERWRQSLPAAAFHCPWQRRQWAPTRLSRRCRTPPFPDRCRQSFWLQVKKWGKLPLLRCFNF